MGRSFQAHVLSAAKALGAANVARWYTRRGLRIICFHGISFDDEHLWNPDLFMTLETFRARLAILRRLRVPVVRLQDVARGDYPDHAVVITFDDGWTRTTDAADILQQFGYPSTLYATTHYMRTGMQIFNVLVPYLLWKTKRGSFTLPGTNSVCSVQTARTAIEARGEALSSAERRDFACEIARALDVSNVDRLFRLISEDEARALPGKGMELELHTHRHSWRTADSAWNARELRDNRDRLAPLTSRALQHLCYPSGVYASEQFPVLEAAGIVTATTCERGLNFASTHPYRMNRYLDSQAIPPIKFEVELTGLLDILRAPWRLLRDKRGAFRAQGMPSDPNH